MTSLLEAIGLILAGAVVGSGGTILVRARAKERKARAEAAAGVKRP